jgi:hypothetical protein
LIFVKISKNINDESQRTSNYENLASEIPKKQKEKLKKVEKKILDGWGGGAF